MGGLSPYRVTARGAADRFAVTTCVAVVTVGCAGAPAPDATGQRLVATSGCPDRDLVNSLPGVRGRWYRRETWCVRLSRTPAPVALAALAAFALAGCTSSATADTAQPATTSSASPAASSAPS